MANSNWYNWNDSSNNSLKKPLKNPESHTKGMIYITIKDSDDIHMGFKRFEHKRCDTDETWKSAFERGGVRLCPSNYRIQSLGGKVESRNLNSTVGMILLRKKHIGSFITKFKKHPINKHYSVRVQRQKSKKFLHSETPREDNHIERVKPYKPIKTDFNLSNFLESIPVRPFGSQPLSRVFGEDKMPQFAESTGKTKSQDNGSSNQHKFLNQIVTERLKQYMVHEDSMFLLRKEIREAYQTGEWNLFKHRFPRCSHFLLDLLKPEKP